MDASSLSPGAPAARPPALPWDPGRIPADITEIRIVAPRSRLPSAARHTLWIAAGVAALLSLRFVLLDAWPVLVFSALDIGALAVALHLFNRAPVPEERLRIADGEIELIRSDSRGKRTRIALPAFWTRLEASGRSELDHDLWLVFRQQRHPIGLCVSAEERRALEPRIRAALGAARPG